MPGEWLHWLAVRLLAQDTCERAITPLIADLQREYETADTHRARTMAYWSGVAAFWEALGLCAVRAAWRPRLLPRSSFLPFALDHLAGSFQPMMAMIVLSPALEWAVRGEVSLQGVRRQITSQLLIWPALHWLMTCDRYASDTRNTRYLAGFVIAGAVIAGMLADIPIAGSGGLTMLFITFTVIFRRLGTRTQRIK